MSTTSTKQVAEAIYELSKSTDNTAALARSIAYYLVSEHQTRNADRILREVERLRLVRDGKLEITATSAHVLSPAVKAEIINLFDAKNKTLIERVDSGLVGGVSIQAMDNWLDLSVRDRLKRLKNTDYLTSNLKG